jgi:hypothetical protein
MFSAPYAESLPVQAEEGLAVAVEVEETATPPTLFAATNTGKERAVAETVAPQMGLESQAGSGPGDDDVVMVPIDQGAPPSPLVRDHGAIALEALETPEAASALTIGGAEDPPTFGSWSIPGVRVIDLDTTELPSNDREIFEAVVERVFADLSVLKVEIPGAVASAYRGLCRCGRLIQCGACIEAAGTGLGRRCRRSHTLRYIGSGGGGCWRACSWRGVGHDRTPTPDCRGDCGRVPTFDCGGGRECC